MYQSDDQALQMYKQICAFVIYILNNCIVYYILCTISLAIVLYG